MEQIRSAIFCTVPEASRRSGLGLPQFRRAIKEGQLSVYDIGGWPRVRWDDVEVWMESQRRTPQEIGD